jgi:hypothetical protein
MAEERDDRLQIAHKWVVPEAEKLFDQLVGMAKDAQQKVADDLTRQCGCLRPSPGDIVRMRREAAAMAQPFLRSLSISGTPAQWWPICGMFDNPRTTPLRPSAG